MKIFFIRHGETTGDVENRYGGDYNDHLSLRGAEQSKDVAKILEDKNIEVIYSSPLIRTQETSKFISEKTKKEIITEHDLKERNQYGILTGVEISKAKEEHPDLVELLKDRLNTIEGAESYEDFSERICAVFDKILNNSKYKTIVVVTHGGPLRVLFRDYLKWGELVSIGDCAYVELDKDDEGKFTWIHSGGFKSEFQVPVIL